MKKKKKTVDWWTYWSPRKGVWWPECRYDTKREMLASLGRDSRPAALKGVKITTEDV